MNEKSVIKSEEEGTSPQVAPTTRQAPVISNMDNIQDVENEIPAVQPLTFNVGDTTSRNPLLWLRDVLIGFAVIQLIGMALGLYTLSHGTVEAAAGTELFILIVATLFMPVAIIVAILNVIGVPIYVLQRKARGVSLIVGCTSVVVSILLLLYGLYIATSH